ncbi:MAG: hypothetical protein H0T42_22275 [Deltaproteobacteria bacterium]|nr:hypothetical protein [Deltaproteobacteria bacterium]
MTVRGSRVAEATEHWMELLRGSFGASTIEALLAATEEYQLKYAGVPYCTALRPLFMEASTRAAAIRAADSVNRAIRIAADRLLGDESFRRAIGIPVYIDPLLDIDRDASRSSIMARLDGMFDLEGCIQFIEYNAFPGGLLWAFEANRVLERAPIGQECARRFPFKAADSRDLPVDALIAETLSRGRRLPARLAVAVASTARNISFDGDLSWIPYAASRGCQVTFVDPAQLEVREDGVFAEGERVDVIDIPFGALIKPGQLDALKGALRRGLISSMFGVSQSLLCSSKLTFEALSDPAHADMFDHDTQRALRRHVPWTRRVSERWTVFENQRVDLLPFLAEHRDRFVLKPAGSSGGDGVILGWKCEPGRWDAALKMATKRPHVAQQRVASEEQVFPMLVDGGMVEEARIHDFNPFIFNGKTARPEGILVRASGSIHNVSGGASTVALFVLQDP